MILVRNELCAALCDFTEHKPPSEMVTIMIPARALAATANLYITAAYIPPNSERIPVDIDILLRNVKTTIEITQNFQNYLVIGDFNLPCITWDIDGPTHITTGNIDVQRAGKILTDDMSLLGFKQFNTTKNHAGNTLDLVFCNLPLDIINCSSPLVNIDGAHPALSIDVLDLSVTPLVEATVPKYNFRLGNYEEINTAFSTINWDSLFKGNSTEKACETFYGIVNDTICQYIPLKAKHSTHKYPIWYSLALIKIIKEKSKAHKKWKKYGNEMDYDEFAFLRKRQHRVQMNCFSSFTKRTEQAIKYSSKAFWSYIKSIRGGSNYPKKFTYGKNEFTDGKLICDAFNEFFGSVFGTPSTDTIEAEESISYKDNISRLSISVSAVEKALLHLNVSKGAGCDGIPPIFWRNCSKTLSLPLTKIFNMSLIEGIFPDVWKKAHIVPIHKKGTKINVENYRGISILNTVSNLFERLVLDFIYPVIHKYLPDSQHGFLKKRSTVTNLTCFSNYILTNMDKGGQVDVIYTDFEKAFDRVDHLILLGKLQTLGIHGDLLRWIESYLNKRSQAVVIGGYRSDFIEIPSGIPQGSHLGPLLYNAYIFDIPTCLTSVKHLITY
ncbi:uncharacterized protein LOC131840914 [Achroia grisella]|uniref:uncharacterized protein LOC131840914 n=1 Tax=Achroia grisella TaxID=688607 RepID=UPI0027D30F9C|nr:uncharacterized protein LOC131840914 [Achroia grisella]